MKSKKHPSIKALALGAATAAGIALVSPGAHAAAVHMTSDSDGLLYEKGGLTYYNLSMGIESMYSDGTMAWASSSGTKALVIGYGDDLLNLASATATGRGEATWSNGASETLSRSVELSALWLGNELGPWTGSACGTGMRCATKSLNKTLVNETLDVLGMSFLGISVDVDVTTSATVGWTMESGCTSARNGSGYTFESSAKLGPTADITVYGRAHGSLPLGLASLTFTIAVQVANASGSPVMSNKLAHNSNTDVDLRWSNVYKEKFKSGGGSVRVTGCIVGSCETKTLVSWDSIASSTRTFWDESGTLNNQRAW